jgi:hypothetical protein
MSRNEPPENPDGGGGFLSRWSRVKLERQGEVAKGNSLAPASEPIPESVALDAKQVSEQKEREATELQALLDALPKVEDITASTDVTGFLNARIPDILRNAALRAAWSADPAIRDFLNDAREYALDYNTPGAAHGYGPLTDSDRASLGEMVRNIFGEPPVDAASSTRPLEDDQTLVSDHTVQTGEIETALLQSSVSDLQPRQGEHTGPQLDAVGQAGHETEKSVLKQDVMPDLTMVPSSLRLSGEAMALPAQDVAYAAASPSDDKQNRRRAGGAVPT